MYQIYTPQLSDHPQLLTIWEASVKATHHFVSEEKIQELKILIVEQKIFDKSDIFCVHDENGKIAGFAGVSDDSLDMIFLHPSIIGTGAGKTLMRHALEVKGATKVEVNEENTHAKGFYEHFGFTVYDRSETDEYGQPFPILYMRRASVLTEL